MRAITSRTSYDWRASDGMMPYSSCGSRAGGCGSRIGQAVVRLAVEVVDDLAHDAQRVLVVDRVVIRDAADARVHVGAAELFGGDDLAGRRLHQRRPAQERSCPGP